MIFIFSNYMYPHVRPSGFFCHVFASPRPPSHRKYSSGVTRMHDLGEQMGLILKCAVKAAYVRRHVDICTSRCF